MLISHPLKFIFIHVHRTGGTTIESLLQNQLRRQIVTLPQHANTKTAEASLLETYKEYYTFGFTRNPWERILSWYSLIHKNDPKSLEEERKRLEAFIELDAAADFKILDFHYNSIDYFSDEKGKLKVDKIFRYENFEHAVIEILKRFDLPFTEIPHVNKTSAKNVRAYYTSKSQDLIAQKCKKDIEYFNYVF